MELIVGIDQSDSPCQRISFPPSCSKWLGPGLGGSQNGAGFSICSKYAWVNGSSATPAAPMSVSKAKYCSQLVMNVAGVTLSPSTAGMLTLVPLSQLNSLPSGYPP